MKKLLLALSIFSLVSSVCIANRLSLKDLNEALREDVISGNYFWVCEDLDYGAWPDARFSGESLFHLVNGCTVTPYPFSDIRKIVCKLIQEGLDVDVLDDMNNTPLNTCFKETELGLECNAFLIKVFLEHGANPEIKNNQGISAADKIRAILSSKESREKHSYLLGTARDFDIVSN